jgi:polyisoprenoid-binding protein YceI
MKAVAVLAGVLLLLLTDGVRPVGAEPARWSVIPDRSSISMAVRVLGMTHTGRFSAWAGDIRFDPATPETAEVAIEVRAASLDMRQQSVTRRAVGPAFLDAAHYPSIRFRLRSLEPLSPGRYTARADVTVKAHTRPVAFPVALSLSDGIARMDGGFVLDRTEFGIGTGGGLDGLIARDVRVDVALVTRQAVS